MCRNIKTLFYFEPPATKVEVEAAAEQFVRKVSGFRKPSQVNNRAYNLAVKEISASTNKLMRNMKTDARPRSRTVEAQKARALALKRFGAVTKPNSPTT